MVVLAALALLQGKQLVLPHSDRLRILGQALHYQASRLTGPVTLYAVSAYDYELPGNGEEPFEHLRPLLANLPAPSTDLMNWGAKNPTFLMSASIQDIIDPSHVVVETSVDRGPDGTFLERLKLVLVKANGRWTVTRPTMRSKDENAILQSAMLFLLADKEHGYRSRLAYRSPDEAAPYVTIFRSSTGATRTEEDPSSRLMAELWRRGYHVRPSSEIPSRNGHPAPHCRFGVGDVQAIDSTRALVFVSQEFFSMEPGYNTDYGPSTAEEATFLAIKRKGRWRIGAIQGYWNLDPAE